MPQMIYIAKVPCKTKLEDGTYRNLKIGDYFPEAETFRNPDHWAVLVSVGSKEGKLAMEAHKGESPSNASSIPAPSAEGEGEIVRSEQNKEASNETKSETEEPSTPSDEGTETTEEDKKEENLEEEKSEEENSEDPFKGMSVKDIRKLAKDKFNVKINGNFGRDKVIQAFRKLEEDSNGDEA